MGVSADILVLCTSRMSTTYPQKHRYFIDEPMGEKPVTALSGIEGTLGRKLEEQGFDKVDEIYTKIHESHGNAR